MTPLHLAAEGAHVKIMEYLVERKANINIQDNNGVIIHVIIHTKAARIHD